MSSSNLAMKNFRDSWQNVHQSSPPPKVWKQTEVDFSLWVLDEPFEFGILPMQPSHKISIPLLRKVSAYIKTRNMYPALNLSAWLHIAQLKLQLGPLIPWIYLRMFDIIQQQSKRQDKTFGYWDSRCEQFRDRKKDKKDEFRVPTFEFLIFLYIQNSYKFMKKICAQMTDVVKKRDDRWPIKTSEPKIQSEQLRYQYLHDNIEDLIDFLQQGYKSTDEIPITIIEALNLVLCCTSDPLECVMDPLEMVITTPTVSEIVEYNPDTQTVSRPQFIKWVQTLLKLNPWGPASSFLHAPKLFPLTGSTKQEDKESALQNRIIFNQKQSPYSWIVISNICHQVFNYDEEHNLSNLKLHRCNNSYIYAPGLYSCILIDKCNNSTIFLGVAVKIVRFFGCKNIKLYSASRLVIITDCTTCTFHLLTPCQPILTGSKNENVQFGPYNTFYSSLDDHLQRANLLSNVNKWNDPIQIASDGMSPVDGPVFSLVKPNDFSNFTFPFDTFGTTAKNPCSLPQEYEEAIKLKANQFENWKDEILHEKLSPQQTKMYRAAILKYFESWLTTTGHGKELDGLKNLQLKLEGQKGDVFEFSSDHHQVPQSPSSVTSDSGLEELFGDITMAEQLEHFFI